MADWLAAEVMGGIIQTEGSDQPAKTLAVANQMDQLMCSIVGAPKGESCQYHHGSYHFENDPTILTEATTQKKYFLNSLGQAKYCAPGEFSYPTSPDRFAIFTRSSGIRRALGCNDTRTGAGSRVKSCSL